MPVEDSLITTSRREKEKKAKKKKHRTGESQRRFPVRAAPSDHSDCLIPRRVDQMFVFLAIVASVNSTSAAAKYSSPPLGDYYSNYVAAASSMANDPSGLKFGYSDPSKGVQFAFGFPQHPDSFSALSYNGTFSSIPFCPTLSSHSTRLPLQVRHRESRDANERPSVERNSINSSLCSIERAIPTSSCEKRWQ